MGIIGTCLCQYNEQAYEQQRAPRESYDGQYYKGEIKLPPQILSHKQSLNHDGNFKYAFASENGLLQGETISPDGSRTGAYAYVDPTGRKISVKYIAGKEGFKILEGDHIPKLPPQLSAAQGPHPGFASFRSPNEGPVYTPEAQRSQPPSYGKAVYEPEVPRPAYNNYGQQNLGQIPHKPFLQRPLTERTNEVLPFQVPVNRYQDSKEPEYNDEPGKPNSFGTGYAFEFAG